MIKQISGKRVLACLPAVSVAAAIFLFSAQPAQESTQVSNRVIELLLRTFVFFGMAPVSPERMAELYEILTFPIRKCAHMTEYMILYGTLLPAVGGWKQNRKRCLWTAFGLTVLYACTDEFHQLFVPGRAGRITDVLIDSTGALVLTAVLSRGVKWKEKEKQEDSRI